MVAKKSQLPLKYLDDDLILSDSEAWCYVRIPIVSYEFLTSDDRIGLMEQITSALANLVTGSQEETEVHLRTVHKPFPTFEWMNTLRERVDDYNYDSAPGWEDYSKKMYTHVANSNFYEKKVYLGVKLGDRSRSGEVESGNKDVFAELMRPLKRITGSAERSAGYVDYEISSDELAHWRKKAKEYQRGLTESHFRAEKVTAEEMAWVIASPLWPEIPQPDPSASKSTTWGEGELTQLVTGVVTNKYRFLEIEQTLVHENLEEVEQLTGFTAFLSISRFPDSLYFPMQSPWVYMTESRFPFPVDFSIRFTVVPPMKVKKDVSKKLADARDQAQHIAETGAGVPLNVREQVETATALEYLIDKDRMPWAYSRARLMVMADTEEELKARCKRIIEDYKEMQIDVVQPSGDQFNMLVEAMPGSKTKVNAYLQRQDLAVVAGGMPNASSDCGDAVVKGEGWIGPYIGWTSSGAVSPVMFSPHSSIARNYPPGVAITGSPGGGKALHVLTPILTSDGWKTMNDVGVGDKVYGIDGQLCSVVEKTETLTERPCYKIEFRDGSEIIADADHEWVVTFTKKYNGKVGDETPAINDTLFDIEDKWGGAEKLTTVELFQKQIFKSDNSDPAWFKENKDGGKEPVSCFIPTPEPLRYDNNSDVLPVPPLNVSDGLTYEQLYLLGSSLPKLNSNPEPATSTSSVGALWWESFTNEAKFGLVGIVTKNVKVEMEPSRFVSPTNFRLTNWSNKEEMLAAIREVVYNGNIVDRATVLQGVIDSSITHPRKETLKTYEEGYVKGVLLLPDVETANVVVELFRTLGYITQSGSANDNNLAETFPFSVSGVGSTVEVENLKGEVFVAYNFSDPHEIVSIRPSQSVPVQCIQVDGPMNMYLAGESLIPTHNSFLAFKIAYDLAIQGVWTIYIDPKADAKPMGDIKGLGNAKVFDLRHGNDGMLDPFSLGEDLGQQKLLALETLRLLLGSFSEEREEIITQKVSEVAASPNPSLSKVVDALLADKKSIAQNIGQLLDLIRGLDFARLCFAQSTGSPLKPEDGLTIVTLLGLDLPSFDLAPSEYGYENKLAVAVMYLLTRYASKLMLSLDKSHPKAICVDEAWAITSTSQGAKLIPMVARMGRSHNTALVLVSQNAGDLMTQSVTNSISTKFAFRSRNTDEINDVLHLMGLNNEEGYGSAIRNLRQGECLMQDAENRIARVKIDVEDWNHELFEAFNTNPETRGKKE